MADFSSPFYPYEKVQTGFSTFRGAENIPLQIVKYLMDLPDSDGYTPSDNNDRPRVRLMKYLWYDGVNPLGNALPTPVQKQSMLFDGDNPVLDTTALQQKHPQGYRIYPQEFWGQTQTEAKTTLKCYIGRVVPVSPYSAYIGLHFEILVNVNQANTMRTTAYNKAYAIEQCILEALNGVNINGIGVVEFNRAGYVDCGSRYVSDEGTNVGRELKLALLWADNGEDRGV